MTAPELHAEPRLRTKVRGVDGSPRTDDILLGASAAIVYDGDCPICAGYSRASRIRRDVGGLALVNARERPDIVTALAARSFDLNNGFVFIIGDRIYDGAQALHVLALLSSRSSLFNRINFAIFRHRRLAFILYPVLRSLRNLLLRLRRKKPIDVRRSVDLQ